eukprot:4463673-Amphidinium_carterae.1
MAHRKTLQVIINVKANTRKGSMDVCIILSTPSRVLQNPPSGWSLTTPPKLTSALARTNSNLATQSQNYQHRSAFTAQTSHHASSCWKDV